METTSDALDFGLLSYSSGRRRASTGCSTRPTSGSSSINESPVFSPEHLAAVPLTLKGRRADPPRLGDVGKVMWDTWPMVGDAVINDGAA